MQFNLNQYLISEVFAAGVVFCRMGSVFISLPGIGDAFIPARARLLFALALTILLTPVLQHTLPPMPKDPISLFVIIGSEIIYGLFLGLMARVVISVMHTAGMVIATNSGLASAMLFDPNQGSQGTAIGNLLGIVALTLILSTNLYQHIFLAAVNSYEVFTPGSFAAMQDFSDFMVKLAAKSFSLALQIAAPVTTVMVVIFFTAGVLARLMPAIQIFFIMMPIQILLSFVLMSASISGIIMVFLNYFESVFTAGGPAAPF